MSASPDLDAGWRRVEQRERSGLTLMMLAKTAAGTERLGIVNTDTRTTVAAVFFNGPDESAAWRGLEAFADAIATSEAAR